MNTKVFLTLIFLYFSIQLIVAQNNGNLPPISSLPSDAQHRLQYDWAWLARYREDNLRLRALPLDTSRVILIGDSITEGWSNNMPDFFVKHPNFINRGIGGQTTGQLLLRLRPDVIDLSPRTMVILIGINDIAENNGAYNEAETFGNIVSMIQLTKFYGIKPVICSVTPCNSFIWRTSIPQVGDKIISLNEKLKAYAEKEQLIYCDYYTQLVDNQKGTKKELTNDGVHITSEGYQIMANILLKALDKVR